MSEKEDFEAWWLRDVPLPLQDDVIRRQRDGSAYLVGLRICDAWEAWKERATRASADHIVEPTEKVADVAPVAWISVSERLPDFDVPVAVAWDKAPWRTDSVSAVDDMLHARNNDSDGWLWYTVSTGDLDEWDTADMPTHWMQLPPAPAAPA